jgi:hypothetical protein
MNKELESVSQCFCKIRELAIFVSHQLGDAVVGFCKTHSPFSGVLCQVRDL